MDKTVESTVVEATPEECYRVASDFARYPEWAGDIKSVEVLESDGQGRGVRVAFRVAAFGRSAAYTLIYEYPGGEGLELKWHQESADLTSKLDGHYVFIRNEDGTTTVTYALEVDLLVPMPGFVKRRAEAKIVHAALKDLKVRTESLSDRGQVEHR
ncbi:MAG: SRPBCC family protein [Actinomycetota bacterium]|nr:SRPBCC family protein [Actinomycetota bacterium]